MRKRLITSNVSFFAGLAAFARLGVALPGRAAPRTCHAVGAGGWPTDSDREDDDLAGVHAGWSAADGCCERTKPWVPSLSRAHTPVRLT